MYAGQKSRGQIQSSLCTLPSSTTPPSTYIPLVSRGHFLGGLNSDIWVPFSRGKDDDLIQKLINPCYQIFPIPGFISHVTEKLGRKE